MSFTLIHIYDYTLLLLLTSIILIAYWLPIDCPLIAYAHAMGRARAHAPPMCWALWCPPQAPLRSPTAPRPPHMGRGMGRARVTICMIHMISTLARSPWFVMIGWLPTFFMIPIISMTSIVPVIPRVPRVWEWAQKRQWVPPPPSNPSIQLSGLYPSIYI